MIFSCLTRKLFLICSKKKFLTIDLSSHQVDVTTIENSESKKGTEDVGHEPEGWILSAAVSNTGELLAFSDDYKRVLIYSKQTNGYELLVTHLIPRRCSCIQFSPCNTSVLVGDKSGYVYRLPVASGNDQNLIDEYDGASDFLILGHVSMLTDMTISPSGNLLATADRDEKIRLSHYPNTYNIHQFCLGHTAFVSSVHFVSDNILLSASGDSTLRAWETSSGTQLSSLDILKTLLDDVTNPFITSEINFPSQLVFIENNFVVMFNNSPLLAVCSYDSTTHAISMASSIRLASQAVAMAATVDSLVMVAVEDTDRPVRLLELTDQLQLEERMLEKSTEDDIRAHATEINMSRPVMFASLRKAPLDQTGHDIYQEKKAKRCQNIEEKRKRHLNMRRKGDSQIDQSENNTCNDD